MENIEEKNGIEEDEGKGWELSNEKLIFFTFNLYFFFHWNENVNMHFSELDIIITRFMYYFLLPEKNFYSLFCWSSNFVIVVFFLFWNNIIMKKEKIYTNIKTGFFLHHGNKWHTLVVCDELMTDEGRKKNGQYGEERSSTRKQQKGKK